MVNVLSICGSLRKGSYNRMVMNMPGLAPSKAIVRRVPAL